MHEGQELRSKMQTCLLKIWETLHYFKTFLPTARMRLIHLSCCIDSPGPIWSSFGFQRVKRLVAVHIGNEINAHKHV